MTSLNYVCHSIDQVSSQYPYTKFQVSVPDQTITFTISHYLV